MISINGQSPNYIKISYIGGTQNTGNLEPGTTLITATSQPAISAAQYSSVLTLTQPSDTRLTILRLCTRLNVNIVANTTNLHLAVRVDVDDVDHEIFTESWANTGNKLNAVDIHSGFKPDVLALLTDGAAHTFYFLFWVDVTNLASVSVVQLWFGAGSITLTATDVYATPPPAVFTLTFSGGIAYSAYGTTVGHGTGILQIGLRAALNTAMRKGSSPTPLVAVNPLVAYVIVNDAAIIVTGTVATDLNSIEELRITLEET